MLRIIFGDRVITRRLSQPIVGTVHGFVKAQPYASLCFPDHDCSDWDTYYPTWREGYLVFVLLDNPTDEGKSFIVYPEEDLVVFDDEFVEGLGRGMLSRGAV